MKRKQKLGSLTSILLALALLTLGAYWLQTAQVRAAPSDGTLLLGTSTKEVTPSSVSPGGVAHYAIVLRNSSAMTTVTNVMVGDALPELLTYVPDSAGTVPAGKAIWNTDTPGHITFTVLTLAPQTTVTLTFNAVLSLAAESDAVVSNVASLDDGVVLTWTNPATFTVSQPPAVQITGPTPGTVIEESAGTAYAVSGRAWDNFVDPPFLSSPVLLPFTSPDSDGDYYVRWTAVPHAENYVLEETRSLDSSWTQYPAVVSPTVSQLVTGKANGTYYYRVRAYSSQVTEGRWSNVQSMTVLRTALHHEYDPSAAASQSVLAPTDGELVVEVSPDDGAHWYSATVTNNAGGWWDWTYNWMLPDAEDVAYVLRARARYASGGTFGAEDSITVTIRNSIHYVYLPLVMRRWPPVPYAATLATTATAVRGGNYTLSWTYNHAQYPPSSDTAYELQEATSSAFSSPLVLCSPQTTLCGAARSLAIGMKTPGTYYYRVRALNNYGTGEWSNVIQVVVTAPVPYAPVLADIDNADGNTSYNLNWSYTNVDFLPTSYEVQEATDVNFTANLKTPCTPGASTTCALTGKTVGTYYYRVRGVNAAGAGDWSVAKSAAVTTVSRNYNFDGTLEGWAIRRSDEPVDPDGNPIPQPLSRDNKLYTMIVGSGDFAMISPMETAPSVPYAIVTVADVVNGETINGIEYSPKDQMKYSIIFGANGGTPCPATENTPKNQGCLSHYYRLRVRWDAGNQQSVAWALQRIDFHEGDNDQGQPPKTLAEGNLTTNANDWNKWKIAVLNTSGDNIKVYHGWSESQIASVRDTNYINEPYFGVQIISPNWGSVAVRWDWFQVNAQ